MDVKNLKSNLSYIITRRYGMIEELEEKMGIKEVEGFSAIGLIRLGIDSWSILPLANKYYKDLYGYFSYLYVVVKFKWEMLWKKF